MEGDEEVGKMVLGGLPKALDGVKMMEAAKVVVVVEGELVVKLLVPEVQLLSMLP